MAGLLADGYVDGGSENRGRKNLPGGYAGLDVNGKLSAEVIPGADAQADSTASDTAGIVTDFNALLAKLRAAGILKTE